MLETEAEGGQCAGRVVTTVGNLGVATTSAARRLPQLRAGAGGGGGGRCCRCSPNRTCLGWGACLDLELPIHTFRACAGVPRPQWREERSPRGTPLQCEELLQLVSGSKNGEPTRPCRTCSWRWRRLLASKAANAAVPPQAGSA